MSAGRCSFCLPSLPAAFVSAPALPPRTGCHQASTRYTLDVVVRARARAVVGETAASGGGLEQQLRPRKKLARVSGSSQRGAGRAARVGLETRYKEDSASRDG